MLKKLFALIAGFAALCLIAYGGVWLYGAQQLNNALDEFFARNNDGQLVLYGAAPKVKGFPFAPEATFIQGLQYKGMDFKFDTMNVKGFGFAGLPVTVSFPEGLQIGTPQQPNLLTFAYLEATVSAPNGIPELYEEDLRNWETKASAVDITDYKASLGSMEMSGKGVLAVDQNLQPIVSLDTTATGYTELLASLEANGNITKSGHAAAMLALNALAKDNPETGVKELNIPIIVQNRKLNIGPLMLGEIPEIYWDRRTPLVQPQ